MQKLFQFSFLSILFIGCSGVNEDIKIEDKNLGAKIFKIAGDGMIAEAEKTFGKLYKEERKFTDIETGSNINMVFAAFNKKTLDDYFNTFEVSFKGVNKTELERVRKLASKHKIKSENYKGNNIPDDSSPDLSEVFYDLIAKDIKGDDAGFMFSVKPRNTNSAKGAKISASSWRQQTSLPWCETAVICTYPVIVGGGYKEVALKEQWRGLIWGGDGTNVRPTLLNGTFYGLWIDGPKFTRFGLSGSERDYFNNFGVEWYSVEENAKVLDNFTYSANKEE